MKFPDCVDCANHQTDPWICRYCDNGSNYTPDSDPDSVVQVATLDDLRAIARSKS